MGSWQEWIDTYLMGAQYNGQPTLKTAIICGSEDGNPWAQSAGLDTVAPSEIQVIARGFNDPAGFYANGLRFNGIKFVYVSGDEKVIRARTLDKKTGLHIVKTRSALVLSTYDDQTPAGQVAKVVEGVGDHLKNSGY